MSCIASMPITGGVPLMNRRMPVAGVYPSAIANTSAAPIHPWIGWSSSGSSGARA